MIRRWLSRYPLVKAFVTPLGVLTVLVVVKYGIEHTTWGQEIDAYAHDFLQRQLERTGPGRGPCDVPEQCLALIDISYAEPATDPKATGPFTSRRMLTRLLHQLVDAGSSPDVSNGCEDIEPRSSDLAPPQRASWAPKAIGIDIDFSMEDGRHVAPGDGGCFKHWLALSRSSGVPIYLGVGRGTVEGRDGWLGDAQFAEMAAGILLPDADAAKAPLYFSRSADEDPLPSLATRLARAYDPQRFRQHRLERFTDRATASSSRWVEQAWFNRRITAGSVSEFRVDYSAVSKLDAALIVVRPPEYGIAQTDLEQRIRGRMVLIGAVDWRRPQHPGSDVYRLLGTMQQGPGVYVHASGARSLVNGPLLEMSHAGRVAIDVVLGVIAVAIVVLVPHYFARRASGRSTGRAAHRSFRHLRFFVALAMAAAVLLFAAVFVAATRFLWTDFVLLIVAILAHPFLETEFEHEMEHALEPVRFDPQRW